MKAFFKHMLEQPFVMATGVAALAHSTWALATLFSGTEPEQFTVAWWAWLIPALLIAFALDVGQIVTSSEIRSGQRMLTKYITFGVFAVATYFLQWLYIIHHIPALELSDGVRGEWYGIVSFLRDCAIWIIPALLPLSTLLYTFSSQSLEGQPTPPPPQIDIQEPLDMPLLEEAQANDTPLLEEGDTPILPISVQDISPDELLKLLPLPIQVTCPKCGWNKSYADELSAKRGLAGHKCLAKSSHANNGVAKTIVAGE